MGTDNIDSIGVDVYDSGTSNKTFSKTVITKGVSTQFDEDLAKCYVDLKEERVFVSKLAPCIIIVRQLTYCNV